MNMKSKLMIAVAMLVWLWLGIAEAATVTFSPLSSTVMPGDTFDIAILGQDFAELAGGVIDLGYNDNVVQINTVTIDTYWDFLPDSGGPSGVDTWPGIGFDVFANDPASGDFTIAVINMTALTNGLSNLDILGSSEFFSSTEQLLPTLEQGSITVVPLPGAVWLFGSGLIGLFGLRRRSANSAK